MRSHAELGNELENREGPRHESTCVRTALSARSPFVDRPFSYAVDLSGDGAWRRVGAFRDRRGRVHQSLPDWHDEHGNQQLAVSLNHYSARVGPMHSKTALRSLSTQGSDFRRVISAEYSFKQRKQQTSDWLFQRERSGRPQFARFGGPSQRQLGRV